MVINHLLNWDDPSSCFQDGAPIDDVVDDYPLPRMPVTMGPIWILYGLRDSLSFH